MKSQTVMTDEIKKASRIRDAFNTEVKLNLSVTYLRVLKFHVADQVLVPKVFVAFTRQ